jgi:mannose-6-phosphate isomerase-like protein (cupin superfamily)
MVIKDVHSCKEITAGDNSTLRELLNPVKEGLATGYSLAHARVRPGEATLAHRLTSSEVYYILEGSGEMYVDGQREKISAGQAIYIPPSSAQRIQNTGRGDLVFLCIVDPAWRPGCEELVE